MRPLNLEEFAQGLRLSGDYREQEFADEILLLLDIESEVAEPFGNLCDDLDHYVPANPGKPDKQLEWLGDRSALLSELQDELAKAGYTGDADDALKRLLDDLDAAREAAETDAPKMEYDL